MSKIRHFVKIKAVISELKINGKKEQCVVITPTYLMIGNDLMKKGGKFYAVLDPDTNMWSTDESMVYQIIDRDITNFLQEHYIYSKTLNRWADNDGRFVYGSYINDSSTNRLKEFNQWFVNLPQNHNYVQLDTELTYKSTEVTPQMYRSQRLSYDLNGGITEAYDKLMNTLYSEDDRTKIEWLIGSIYAGDSKKIEKCLVLYGDPGSGKSTILDLVKVMFNGYWHAFTASGLVSKSDQFATADFKDNPLLAIQDDGRIDKIESPVINEIISHKEVVINEKGKSRYTIKSNAILLLATNHVVDIHDTKLGISRRLLDVYPSGRKIKPASLYRDLKVRMMTFEIGSIAKHCYDVYMSLGRDYYEEYVPEAMIKKTNYLRNFMFDYMDDISRKMAGTSGLITRNELYDMYKAYCEDSGLSYPPTRPAFTEQIKEYFETYEPIKWTDGGTKRHVFGGLKIDKIMGISSSKPSIDQNDLSWLTFNDSCGSSVLDKEFPDAPAQYAVVGGERDGDPETSWAKCKTKLKDIDPHKLHWFLLPKQVIKMDFDLKDQNGNKSLELSLKVANKFPKTYAEVSKSGQGIHLYYNYDGDVDQLSRIYDENIEVKVNCPHRRLLSKCNDLQIATISTGLPLKEAKPKTDNVPLTVKGLRTTIRRCLAKEIHADTTSNVDWIKEILDRAYDSGLAYDVSDMKNEIEAFAANSSHQSARCLKQVSLMKFKSGNASFDNSPSKEMAEAGEELVRQLQEALSEPVSGTDDQNRFTDEKKGGTPVIDERAAEDEMNVRNAILNLLQNGTKETGLQTIQKMDEVLTKAFNAGLTYDINDIRQDIIIFSINSDQKEKAYELARNLRLSSEKEGSYNDNYNDAPLMFFDYEVFPNLVLLCYKIAGEGNPVVSLFNPTPDDVAKIFGINYPKKYRAVGFNCKEYDNHITYAIYMGKSTYEVFLISQAIIGKDKHAKFREAKHLSYTDILDFCPEKISLKKWEIRLGIHHQELNFPWDQPVPESKWDVVASYCKNDVIATEAVFYHNEPAYKGRLILVDLANILMGPGSVPNDSTNDLTTKLIVGNERNPQKYFVYPNLAEEFPGYEFDNRGIDKSRYISNDVIITGKSIYRGYDPGEGGFVWAKHGMYGLSESDDSASHHPSTIIAKNGFGKFTPNFKRLLDLRLMVKHKEYDKLRGLYDGALAKYLTSDADAKALSFALKIAINSVYGLTAAKFSHPLRDPRNVDNWVAKRGALFMIDLMLNVQEMGYTVLHCKTDSIKILHPDDKIRTYIQEFGKKYGYTFEIEHRFERLCLVNDAVYVCKYTDEPVNEDMAGKWDATGKQFQVPYVFKTLFSHEPIEFDDLCETKNTSTALYLDFNEDLPEGEHNYVFVGKTGQFCPIKPGCGGGILYREKDGKYYAAESTTGFRWLESEVVKELGKEADIDESFYRKQVDKAVDTISKYGDFDSFTAEGPYVDMSFMNVPETEEEEIPF